MTSIKSENNTKTDDHSTKEITALDQAKQNLSFKKTPDVHETEISMDKKVDLTYMSPEKEEEEQVLEKVYKQPGEGRAEVGVLDARIDGSDSK